MKLTHNQSVRTLQVLNHIAGITGISWAVYNAHYSYLLIALLTYWVIGILGINIGLHRLLSHRSFKTNQFWEKLCSVIGVITTVGSPLAWAAIHRQHHRRCDQPGDPHSPHLIGNWRAWFGVWNIEKLDLKLVRDIRADNFQRMLHKHYVLIILTFCLLLAAIDPWLVIFAYCIPACLCYHSSSAIVVIAHRHGYITHQLKHDRSRNSWIANLITLGDGWHNNHHAHPYRWSNWERWWEWDVPAIIIWCIKKS